MKKYSEAFLYCFILRLERSKQLLLNQKSKQCQEKGVKIK